ncbi:MAG: dihydropteroate synthase [Prevotella sp.]|nr:dihydropteroate synthase [Prevotella sp.]
MEYTLNIRGQLFNLDTPKVMGILNATPDSFFADSRTQTEEAVARRAETMLSEGADFIDIGGCSTRPGADLASASEETERLRLAVTVVRRNHPNAIISVDTFRPDVARMAVEELGADLVNDVSGGSVEMFRMVARLGVPYVLTSVEPDLRQSLLSFACKVQQLRDYGQKDILLDPGFGFGKTLEQNYQLLASLEKLAVMQLPLLVGLSRKSMIWKLLQSSPDEALGGTTVLNTVALMKGASVLRVHDVRQAAHCIRLFQALVAPPQALAST